MDTISVKRTLRKYRRLEQELRADSGGKSTRMPLVWDVFFDLRDLGKGTAKYNLQALTAMNREAYQKVIGEYWAFVYQALNQEIDFQAVRFDADILLRWNLPADADADAVKQRFRTLAKRHHPDTGGDADSFIALMREYKTLLKK